jgi:hypothetical protein
MQLEFTRTGPYEYSCTVHGPTDPYVAQYNTVQLYSRRKLAGIQRSLGNRRISQNRRNLQNRNSAAAEIAIRFGPKILLKCDRRESGPKFRTIGLDYGYKSSFYTQSQVQSLRPAHYKRRRRIWLAGWLRGRPAAACCWTTATPPLGTVQHMRGQKYRGGSCFWRC